MNEQTLRVIHEGRSGYIQIGKFKYTILMEQNGHFTVMFPGGNRHRNLRDHLNIIQDYCDQQTPKWVVENRSRKSRKK